MTVAAYCAVLQLTEDVATILAAIRSANQQLCCHHSSNHGNAAPSSLHTGGRSQHVQQAAPKPAAAGDDTSGALLEAAVLPAHHHHPNAGCASLAVQQDAGIGGETSLLALELQAAGYKVHLRSSLGGGEGPEAVRNLRHSFIHCQATHVTAAKAAAVALLSSGRCV